MLRVITKLQIKYEREKTKLLRSAISQADHVVERRERQTCGLLGEKPVAEWPSIRNSSSLLSMLILIFLSAVINRGYRAFFLNNIT
jgi:hypothetical protein